MTAPLVGHFDRKHLQQSVLKSLSKSGYPAEMVNSGNRMCDYLGQHVAGQLWQRITEEAS